MNIVLYNKKNDKVKIFTSTGSRDGNKSSLSEDSIDDDVLLISSLSLVSKIQLLEWLRLSSWFEGFEPISIAEAFALPVVFYNSENSTIMLCDKNIKSYKIDDVSENNLPDKMAYVESAKIITKDQFLLWAKSSSVRTADKKISSDKTAFQIDTSKKYVHCKSDGTVILGDILLGDGSPLILSGKYHFVPVDSIGEDRLEKSAHYKILTSKGKIELVDEKYVSENKNKQKKAVQKSSLTVGSVKDFEDTVGDAISIDIE